MSNCAHPIVSIIMPAYNSAIFVRETISSVLAQDYENWEMIIVDDGSTDDTAAIVQQLDPRIRLIRQENSGIAAARNTGLLSAKGMLIAFLDHDDYWHPKKLSSQVQAFEKYPDNGVIYSLFVRWNPSQPPEFAYADIDITLIDKERSGWIYHLLLQTNWVLFSTALFRREVFDTVGLFDPALPPADDWDMAIRVSRQYKFLMLSQPLALYRVHPQQTSKRVAEKNHEAELRGKAIANYGLTSPGGMSADPEMIKQRQYRAHYNHGVQHLEIGSLYIARQSLIAAISIKPFAPKAWLKLAYSFCHNVK